MAILLKKEPCAVSFTQCSYKPEDSSMSNTIISPRKKSREDNLLPEPIVLRSCSAGKASPGVCCAVGFSISILMQDKYIQFLVPTISGGKIVSLDRKSTRLNSSHPSISYAVFCLKKKKNNNI